MIVFGASFLPIVIMLQMYVMKNGLRAGEDDHYKYFQRPPATQKI